MRLEKVQHRATRIPRSLKTSSYEDRCLAFGPSTLEERRIRGDMFELYKIKTDRDEVDWHHNPERGLNVKLHRELIKNCNKSFYFFLNRSANIWNSLPSSVISANSTNSFKNRLDALGDLRTIHNCHFREARQQ